MVLAKKEDKKDQKFFFSKNKQEHIGEQKEQTPAIGVNIIETPKMELKIKCFNCNKRDYYAKNCMSL